MTRAVVPHMIDQGGGNIVNVTSMAGVVGLPGNPAYSASKAGVDGLMRSNAAELGKYGIRVNDVAPSFVKGRMSRRISFFYRKLMQYASPIREVLSPEQVANTVLMYASNQTSGTTGTVHAIDNGLFRAK